jgi:colanic acid biosynthesis protein WcaH
MHKNIINGTPQFLDDSDLASVIRLTPLVCIDLLLRDTENRLLVGLRNNDPAKGFLFVPGGRVRKGEKLQTAFERILLQETGCQMPFSLASFFGVYEHFYETNRFGDGGFGTHCVTLAFELQLSEPKTVVSDAQHEALYWMTEAELLKNSLVHHDTKAYFKRTPARP